MIFCFVECNSTAKQNNSILQINNVVIDDYENNNNLLQLNLNKKDHFFCAYCNINFASKQNYNYHCANNKKHNEMVSKSDNIDKEKEDEDLVLLSLNKKNHFFCAYCNIDFTSKRN